MIYGNTLLLCINKIIDAHILSVKEITLSEIIKKILVD